jgi:hypothetical protein
MHVGRHDERVVSNVGSFIANLPEMLGAMVTDPRCLVAVIEFEDVRYVQYWVDPDGAIVAEVISNLNIGDAVALSPEDEAKLRDAGWSEPSLGPRPNWRYEANDIDGLMRVVAMSRHVVYDVLRERDANEVSVRIWEGRYAKSPNDEGREPTRFFHRTTRRDLEGPIDED